MTKHLRESALGQSDIRLTSFGLGMVPLAGFRQVTSYSEFEGVINAAYAGGIRHFDTAPLYGHGKAEYFLGMALRELSIRQSVVVSSKVGRVLRPLSQLKADDSLGGIQWVDPLPFFCRFDYTYDGIMRSYEDSLIRLAIDRIDVLLIHDIGRARHGDANELYMRQLREGGYRALNELRSSCAVSAIGVGVNETDVVLDISGEVQLDCALIAGRYTLLNQQPLDGAFDRLRERKVSVLAAGVFNSGVLATGTSGGQATYDYGSVPPAILEKVSLIEKVCDDFGVPLPTAAVEFVRLHPAVATVVLGSQNIQEIADNLRTAEHSIPTEFWQELKRRELIDPRSPVQAAV